MKNLANCTPREFLAQTVKIKRAAEKWLTATDISAIRKRSPDITDDMTVADKKEAWKKQAYENLGDMFDELAENHPEETIELMAMMCFVDPEHVDDHPMVDYLKEITEMISNDAVIGFFISLLRLARSGIFRL